MDDINQTNQSNIVLKKFNTTRSYSLKLVESLSPEDTVIQTDTYVSPIKWHLGHTTWFFERFVLKPYFKNYRFFNKKFDYIFNSYYLKIGNFNEKSRRGFLNRPLFNEVLSYRNYVDEHINKLLSLRLNKNFFFKILLGINHEQQHQELMLMDIKNIFFNNPFHINFLKKRINKNFSEKSSKNEFLLSKKVSHKCGFSTEGFCYDNELPAFQSQLRPFRLTNFVTNGDWKKFINNGGYKNYKYWLSDGWDYLNKNKIDRPMYWLDLNNLYTLHGVQKIDEDAPVSHISYFEAHAYANYKNLRLPEEGEMEFVLNNTKLSGNFLDNQFFTEISYGKYQMNECFFGNLWVWTSSNYKPYRNYKPFSNDLTEYNSKFMCNQFVLKGGSFATPKNHIRSSYRNFYYPTDRWQFCGLRLIEDLN